MQQSSPVTAPRGFTRETWSRFARDGILVLEDVLSESQVKDLTAALEEHPEPSAWNVVESDPRLAEMIDSPTHVGYVYDVYGEMLKLLRSEFFKREPDQQIRNKWHFDGPRALPFEVFSPKAPLRLKVGYWLTPLHSEDMGNLTYVPGSHHWAHLPQYHTHERHPEERQILLHPGAMTLMWSGLWHRVAENRSDRTRLNLFYEYGPTWMVTSDRTGSDQAWLETLPRERRILMRQHRHPNQSIKLPQDEVPLYLPRPDEPDPERDVYSDAVPLALRKRSTWLEREGLL
ncbi:phytanoyl-CoA dioxygenase family protein [Nocardiopsis sp. NPDC007018]|uniref:phytanoyl-CoA dioxygenase family protein n=1 Tax=Nocardiopsis sp. NPDC007018 TaxID=3155721 RepID=UPI0033F82BF7